MHIGQTILLTLAALVAANTLGAATETGEKLSTPSEPPSKPRAMPSMLNWQLSELLERKDFANAKNRCAALIDSAPLVSEPGALAAPYYCLGEALYGLGSYQESAVAFEKSVEELVGSSSAFDSRLALPLEGLGKALVKLEQPKVAEAALERAKDITHRNLGIYNLAQSDIVNRLTRSYFRRGEMSDATREQNFLLRANEEFYGETPQLLPAIRRMAKWHELTGRYDLARTDYRRAVGIMQRAYGSDDLRLVGPLRDFAQSYINTPRSSPNRVMSRAGANALMEIVQLYERQEFPDVADLARSWSELGDWYVIGGRRSAAKAAYREAGKVLQQSENGKNAKSDLFAAPVEIEYQEVPIGIRRSRIESLPPGIAVLEFEFDVSEVGRVMNLVVVRDDIAYPRFALEVGQRVKASRYRPRIVDGQPVKTTGVRKVFRYDFSRSLEKRGIGGSTDGTSSDTEEETLVVSPVKPDDEQPVNVSPNAPTTEEPNQNERTD